MLEERLGDNLQKSMLCDKNELPLSMSKFYIKTNKVVENM